ncbi:hypothetical protein Taro_027431 [Colocasia esculenta]|uniref:Protein kinase domain-containing protein n=1 Tax=Colocasia esculenta TaxID=4460 RepID=A0A843VFN4_COLES|nr:hypothetical protein [Colocasia esculenta]
MHQPPPHLTSANTHRAAAQRGVGLHVIKAQAPEEETEKANSRDLHPSLFLSPVMEQLRQIGEVLGSLKVLMAFQDEIQINKRQCCLLVDAFNLAFESVTEEVRRNLNFEERSTKWKALDHPLKELYRIFREGEQFVRQCMEVKDWWVKAISLGQNTDCVEFHLHNLLWCIPVVMEAIETAGEISGCDQDGIQKKRIIFSKKYEREWMDPKLFQHKFGGQHLVSQSICSRMGTVWKEDRWMLLDMISEKRSSMSKQESRLAELLEGSRGRIFPSSILVGSKDYQVRRRLGSGSYYKEIQWMGENFAVRHFFGSIEPLVPEISLLLSLAHPNVMNFLCAFSDDEKKECFLVMELMQKSLCNHIKEICGPKRKVPFPLPVAVDIMLQIARGMEYLHSRKIYHGNLNPSSILVKTRSSSSDGYLLVKIADIGLATVKNLRASSANQSATDPCIWFAPEVLQEQEQEGDSCESKYTEKADVYSFGMICFELLTGKVPFEDGHLQGDKMSRNIRAGERPLFPFPSPKYLTSLTKRCWQTDPSQRPTFSSICRMLRYIKRFLILNPDHSQPDAPVPPVDYFDLETSLSRGFTSWAGTESMHISQVPFQMYAYRVIERERTSVNVKDKSSESGSDGTSVCGDENVFSSNVSEEAFSVSLSSLKSAAQLNSEAKKKIPLKKAANGKTNKESGQKLKSRAARPPQLTPCGRSMRMNSEGQLPPLTMKPGRRRSSGHASDSELA